MNTKKENTGTGRACVGQRILGAIDLAIDFATLGEYGLEPLPAQAGARADGPCRERPGHVTGWEAFAEGSPRGVRAAARAPDRLGVRLAPLDHRDQLAADRERVREAIAVDVLGRVARLVVVGDPPGVGRRGPISLASASIRSMACAAMGRS